MRSIVGSVDPIRSGWHVIQACVGLSDISRSFAGPARDLVRWNGKDDVD